MLVKDKFPDPDEKLYNREQILKELNHYFENNDHAKAELDQLSSNTLYRMHLKIVSTHDYMLMKAIHAEELLAGLQSSTDPMIKDGHDRLLKNDLKSLKEDAFFPTKLYNRKLI